MDNFALRAQNLGKRYRIGTRQVVGRSFRETLIDIAKAPFTNAQKLRSLTRFDGQNDGQADDIIWALRDVSFNVRQGEALGIIGANGAGKSTLLKILSRITEPTTGFVDVLGRVSSLLEVGTGFHPELTGRENVYLNASILGMRKAEIDRKFDEIVEFSGIGKFLDTPVKRYSTGMAVRLAFSVAAHIDPEVLIVDEVLAVGDLAFQKKCLGKMGDVARQGRTVLFVSHNLSAIGSLCETVMWLEGGKIRMHEDAQTTISSYLSSETQSEAIVEFDESSEKLAQIARAELLGVQGNRTTEFDINSPVAIKIHYVVRSSLRTHQVGITVWSEDGTLIFVTNSSDQSEAPTIGEIGEYAATLKIPANLLASGQYTVGMYIEEPNVKWLDNRYHERVLSFRISGNPFQSAERRPGLLIYPFEWETIRTSKSPTYETNQR